MPSLADIPPQFQKVDMLIPFLAWLKSLQVHRDIKKELLFLWSAEMDYQFDGDTVINTIGTEF